MNVLNLPETPWKKRRNMYGYKTPLNPMRKIRRKYSIL
jgi:hypothetical protein